MEQSLLPTLTYAVRETPLKRVRSFGYFDDLRVPDIDADSSDGGSSDWDGDNSTGSAGGYVQDVSSFDRILLASWEDKFAAGLFRYDVTACKTKVVPGTFGFVAQFNEGRATKKRPTEFSVDTVCQDFDGGKFNFTKADKQEVLFCFQEGQRALSSSEFNVARPVAADATVVLINVSPIEYGHVLLCPRVTDCLPQRITPELLLPPLYMAAESRNPYFRVGYNSLGAYATINHLHFQAYYLMEAFPIERAPTSRLPSNVYKKRHRHGSTVSQVVDYPVRCLCFELGDSFESLAELVGTCCERLQGRNIPFNLLIADHGARVFLIPQKFSHRAAKGEIPADVAATGINPAVFEISGHLLYKQQEDYDDVTEETAVKMLQCASLTEEDFYETCTYILDEEGVRKHSALERIPGSVDGGSRALPAPEVTACDPQASPPSPLSAATAISAPPSPTSAWVYANDDQSVPDIGPPAFDRRSLDRGCIELVKTCSTEASQLPSPTYPPLNEDSASSDSEDAVVPS
jgi:GDP-L-galactose phosphorylase